MVPAGASSGRQAASAQRPKVRLGKNWLTGFAPLEPARPVEVTPPEPVRPAENPFII